MFRSLLILLSVICTPLDLHSLFWNAAARLAAWMHCKTWFVVAVMNKGVSYMVMNVLWNRCEGEDMEEFALHLLVLAHAYMLPSLKRLCTDRYEHGLLNSDNVVDVLQVARYSFLTSQCFQTSKSVGFRVWVFRVLACSSPSNLFCTWKSFDRRSLRGELRQSSLVLSQLQLMISRSLRFQIMRRVSAPSRVFTADCVRI